MSTIKQNVAPYFNDHDPAKRFSQVLAKPGKALQARELNEMQSIIMEYLKRVSNTLLSEGDIISGLNFHISDDGIITVESGLVYLSGLVHIFEQQSLQLTETGEENIGIKLQQNIVTYAEDSALRDPAVGFKNYMQEGADRLRSTVVLTLNDPEATTLYSLKDGELQSEAAQVQLDVITSMLARRTYDESGNYRVEGLTLSTEEKDAENLSVVIDAGKAYVAGYEVNKTVSTRVTIPKALVTRLIQNESFTYNTGTARYSLSNNPVKRINRLVASVLVEKERVIRGNEEGGTDYLAKNSVSKIVRIWSEQPGGEVLQEYTPTTDYQLVNAQAVSWFPNMGIEPPSGGTYYVSYEYNETLENGVDYQLHEKSETEYQVDFSLDGRKPVNASTFYVDYDFYLARKDLISMDKAGNIIVTRGQPNVERLVSSPTNTDAYVLHLGTVALVPNSVKTTCNSYAITRLSMDDLQRMLQRIKDIEYNQAVQALDEEAIAGENPTQLKGVMSDSFFNLNKCDLGHIDFNITLDIEEGTITLPVKEVSSLQPSFGANTNVTKWGRVVTAPMTETQLVSQPLATGTMLVNPYNVFNKLGVLVLKPAVDNFINEKVITINKEQVKTYTVHRWWYHGGTLWDDTERYLFNNLKLDAGQSWNGWDNKTGTILSSSAKTLLDESAQFMREITIQVEATNLLPNSDNLYVHFDDKQVSALPTHAKYLGSLPGTLKADEKGVVSGSFKVPPNTPVGTREVAVKNANNTAISSFTSSGRNRTVEKTVLTTRVTVYPYDPLAQSFQLSSARIISSVGIYFASKDPASNVTVQLRNMVNGYPGVEIYSEKVVTPEEITISEHGTVETRVKFPDPVLCEANTQYCFVVLTDSDTYSVFVAELGETTLDTKVAVTRQPYLEGTMFSSANALTWSAHQTMDMKFNIYGANFSRKGTIEFEPITDVKLDRLVLLSEYLTPNNTGCTWSIRFVIEGDTSDISTKVYTPISNYEETDLSATIKTFQLKAEFESLPNMSPIMAMDALSLVGLTTELEGSYVSRNTVFPQSASYTTVRQIFEAHIPNGTSVIPQFSTDGGKTWISMEGVSPTTEMIDSEFKRYTYEKTVPQATQYRARLYMKTNQPYVRPKARRFMNICK